MEILSTMKIFGTGQVTLPKTWREKTGAKYFIAEETPQGLLIKPITEAIYYETEDGNFGLNFPFGISAGKLLKQFKKANEKIR